MQATIATLGNDDAAVGYSISYPFGVAGPILLLYIAFLLLKPKIDAAAPTGARALEVTLHNPDLVGKTLAEITAALPSDAQIVALRTGHHNKPAAPELVRKRATVCCWWSATPTCCSKSAPSLASSRQGA